jgi:hypothetical protein
VTAMKGQISGAALHFHISSQHEHCVHLQTHNGPGLSSRLTASAGMFLPHLDLSGAGDPFDLPLPHDILRPVQKTAPSGPWLFPRGGPAMPDSHAFGSLLPCLASHCSPLGQQSRFPAVLRGPAQHDGPS